MLFSNDFHRGSYYRPSRLHSTGSCGTSAKSLGIEPASNPGREQDLVKPNATTIVTVRDKNDPKRTKTIITLKRRQVSRLARKPAQATSTAVKSGSANRDKQSKRSAEPRPETCTPPDNTQTISTPESPGSTLHSGWKMAAVPRSPSSLSFDSARMDGTVDTCDTDLTQIDDGLSDWGLPKVIDYHGFQDQDQDQDQDQGQDQDQDDDGKNFESCDRELVPIGVPSALEASAFPYDEPEVASFDYPVPSAAQVRLQRVLVLIYFALFLKKRDIVAPRYNNNLTVHKPAEKEESFSSTLPIKKSPLLCILPFASWI